MSAPAKPNVEPIHSKAQLVEYIAGGEKPRENWLIGTEHEKFVFHSETMTPVAYDGESGICALLEGLKAFGWKPLEEKGKLIALTQNGANITLEPGGQFELSGAPLLNVHQTCRETNDLGLGFNPKWKRDDSPWMPKGRYAIMRRYMPLKGHLGLDMMLRTCTVQVNLDFASEADMVKKYRVALALQPIATALWANSPFVEGKPSGFKSFRAHIWTDTDPDRTGLLPFVFEDGMGYERHVDYVLDVPMYFVYRDGTYIDVAGSSFRDFMQGKLAALPGELPTMGDWADHLTTIFPEVRLKRYIEMRGADGGPWRRLCALPAYWVGLLYDTVALDAAWDLVKDWTIEERATLRADVPRLGLQAPFRKGSVQEIARETLKIARDGLERRAQLDSYGRSEAFFLETLDRSAESGLTPADEMLADFAGRWGGDIDEVYREYAY
jgi:glutamate--cysteine ligase